MEVIAASPDASVEFSNALIGYAEERVSNITQRLRDDQMKGAIESFEDAQIARNEALDRLVTLQQELSVIDSKTAVASIQQQIMSLEQEVDQMEKSLAIHMENARPNTSKVNALKTSIRSNKDLIEAKRAVLGREGIDADELERLAGRGVRYTGSDSTRIYCYPSCRHARRTMTSHEVTFRSAEDATTAGYRPCRVCRPLEAAPFAA